MTWQAPNLNLLMAWAWILAGFASGALLGLGFVRENFLGGYTSLRRRMYRLGHISFFGLGLVNLVFYLTARALHNPSGAALTVASWTFMVGAVSMPVCCLIQAHHPKASPPALFSVPVASLLAGGILTLCLLVTS